MTDKEFEDRLEKALEDGEIGLAVIYRGAMIGMFGGDRLTGTLVQSADAEWDERGVSRERNEHGLRKVRGVEELRSTLAPDVAVHLPKWYGVVGLDADLPDEQEFSIRQSNSHWYMINAINGAGTKGIQAFQKYAPPYEVGGVPTYTWKMGATNRINLVPSEMVANSAIAFAGGDNPMKIEEIPALALKFAEEQVYIKAGSPI